MLKRLVIKNFLSFGQMENGRSWEFSMIPGQSCRDSHHIFPSGDGSLLMGGFIFDANGAGKSNLMTALSFMRNCLSCLELGKSANNWNRCRIEHREQPSYFEVEIAAGGKSYAYGFEILFSASAVISEWLVDLTKGEEEILFERDIQADSLISDRWENKFLDWMKNRLRQSQPERTLLMALMNQEKPDFPEQCAEMAPFKAVWNWFFETLRIVRPGKETFHVFLNPANRFESLLPGLGTGISEVKRTVLESDKVSLCLPEETKRELDRLHQKQKEQGTGGQIILRTPKRMFAVDCTSEGMQFYPLLFLHTGIQGSVEMAWREESSGTRRLADLLEILVDPEDHVFLVDGLDEGLHPNLVSHILKMFFSQKIAKPAQLIAAVHTSSVINLQLLRRDEIWFVEKDILTGCSRVFSLDEINHRFDQWAENAYLDGRYGGIPVICHHSFWGA